MTPHYNVALTTSFHVFLISLHGKSCLEPSIKFNNCIFYILLYLLFILGRFFTMIWSFNSYRRIHFLSNFVNLAYPFFILGKWPQERDQNIGKTLDFLYYLPFNLFLSVILNIVKEFTQSILAHFHPSFHTSHRSFF